MAKQPKQTENRELLQAFVTPELAQRFYDSSEYKIHQNISAALRAILDKVLPTPPESQEKNATSAA